jgi:hypothetical protein
MRSARPWAPRSYSAATSDLVQAALPRASLPALGAYRLKDLAHPEQVFQVASKLKKSAFDKARRPCLDLGMDCHYRWFEVRWRLL